MTNPNEVSLLPCPFCGSADTYAIDLGGWESFCKECGTNGPALDTERDKVIAAWNARAAIALPEQGKVYQYRMANGSWIDQTKASYDYNVKHGQAVVRVLHTAAQPVQTALQPLTDEQIDRIPFEEIEVGEDEFMTLAVRKFARAIEAAHGIKV